jgi:hypothetical protein
MEMARKGIVGGLVTAAVVWLPRPGDALPAFCRGFRPRWT